MYSQIHEHRTINNWKQACAVHVINAKLCHTAVPMKINSDVRACALLILRQLHIIRRHRS